MGSYIDIEISIDLPLNLRYRCFLHQDRNFFLADLPCHFFNGFYTILQYTIMQYFVYILRILLNLFTGKSFPAIQIFLRTQATMNLIRILIWFNISFQSRIYQYCYQLYKRYRYSIMQSIPRLIQVIEVYQL